MITTTSLMAYIGPGGGIALLGPLVGVVLAILGAIGMVAFYPLKAMWKRMRAGKNNAEQSTANQ